jgi:predicted nucleotidyltransferase
MSSSSGNSAGAASPSATAIDHKEPLPPGLQDYLDAIVRVCRDEACTLSSVLLFGSSVTGGYSEAVSDVDLILVLADDTSKDSRIRLREQVERLEVLHASGGTSRQPQNALESLLQTVTADVRSFFICTHGDFVSADVARIFDIAPAQGIFVDRIVLASILGSATTVWGKDLLPQSAEALPPIRRLDVLKVFFYLYNQVLLSAVMFPWVRSSTRYAMGALKHCVHSCYFCYHMRPASLSEEVAFFAEQTGADQTLNQLLSLRREYQRSFAFVLRCLPAIARLHLRTIRDNPFPAASPLFPQRPQL